MLLIKTILLSSACLYSFFAVTTDIYGAKRPIHQIAMITWRGTTDAELGFIDSMKKSNLPIKINIHAANQDLIQLAQIIQKLKSNPPDLIYVFGTTANKNVLKSIKNTPVVFNIVNRPIESGVIKSWENSGNNATGASNQVPVINQLKTLKKVIDFKHLGILYNPMEQNSLIQRDIARGLETRLGFKTSEFQIRNKEDIPRVMPKLKIGIDAIYIPADSKIISLGKEIGKYITEYKIPSFAAVESLVTEHGVLIGLIPDFFQLGQLAAQKAVRILKGESPNEIPASTLEYFNVSVNMVTAQKIGTQIPMSLLIIANKIVR